MRRHQKGAGPQSRCAGQKTRCSAEPRCREREAPCFWDAGWCGSVRRKRRAARGCDSSGQAQGLWGQCVSVPARPSRECAGFQQAPSLLGAKGDGGRGGMRCLATPRTPLARCGTVPRTPFLFACWLPSSRSTVCDADAPWAHPVYWSRQVWQLGTNREVENQQVLSAITGYVCQGLFSFSRSTRSRRGPRRPRGAAAAAAGRCVAAADW